MDIHIPETSNAEISDGLISDPFNANLTESNLLPTVLVTLKDPNEINSTVMEQIDPIVNTVEKNNLTVTSVNYSKELNLASINVTDRTKGGGGSSIESALSDDITYDIISRYPNNNLTFNKLYLPDVSKILPSIQNKISDAIKEINITGLGTPEVDQVFTAQYEQAQVDDRQSQLIGKASESQIIPLGFSRVGGDVVFQKLNNSNFVDADIAIVDSGINNHTDLNIFKHKSFVVNSTSDTCAHGGHGTHVAGIAAAKNNDFGVVGTAPGARLWDVKVLDKECNTTKDSLLKGLLYVLDNADDIDVVNLSLGGFCDPSSRQLCNSKTIDKILTAISKKIIIVVAAGNGITDSSSHKKKPSDSKDWVPAKYPDVLTISNFVDSDGKCGGHGNITYRGKDDFLANTSNFGQPVAIAAPGVNVLSTSNNGSYTYNSGTSMSAPLVAGTAALYKSLHPTLTPDVIIASLSGRSVQEGTACEGSHGYILGGDPDNYPEPVFDMTDFIP